jgi:transaldolase
MIKLFADGADMQGIKEAADNPRIAGFTTNPTLMRQAGVTDYEKFAKECIEYLAAKRPETCLSLEVFDDDIEGMYNQAIKIQSWGAMKRYRVFVKIPVMNTKKVPTYDLVRRLSDINVNCNVTAVFTKEQVEKVTRALNPDTHGIISIFAGRIADAGVDPVEVVRHGAALLGHVKFLSHKVKILWASAREPYNYIQAEQCRCDIITMTPQMIKKLDMFGKDLEEYSHETVEMFYNDAVKSGFKITL